MSMFEYAGRRLAVLSTVAAGLVLTAAPGALADSGTPTPTAPTQLFSAYRTCSGDPDAPTYVWARGGVLIEGMPGDTGDAAGSSVSVQYRVWPVADPARTTTVSRQNASLGYEAPATVPATALTDGQTYGWQAQTQVGSDTSDWSATCYFAADDTAPSPAPTVTSANYPQSGLDDPGDPVHFTFDAAGADDVAGFEFGWQNDLPVDVVGIGAYGVPQPTDPYDDTRYYARADHLGGSASVDLVPPAGAGPRTLYVVSLDRAGNESAQSSYDFILKGAAPTITGPAQPQYGQTVTLRLAPDPGLQAKSPTTSYSVEVDDAQGPRTVQVPAAADGTARTRVKLDGADGERVSVTSTSANGWTSDDQVWSTSFDTTPTITSDVYAENAAGGGAGVPGTFTFAPKVKGVAAYSYSFNGADPVTVEAGKGHRATVTWTPADSGEFYLVVNAITQDGVALTPYYYFATAN
ncbi:hypothetical protein [Actinacidiphila yeochonensis]|uniref:hypothetical protein n=1 Tax=Actinacidiphila yeochonensis TaxID=89050 RepID=UPI001E384571|nr:hypothetical protein [Actinacidiphila yeochonensis]